MTIHTQNTSNHSATIADQINGVVEKRIRWEQGAYAAANAELYSILGDCLDLFIAVKRSYDLPKGVNSLMEDRGITYNASTSLELKLVRLIFADANTATQLQNRLFSYARVIRVAADAMQTGTTLAKFIVANHGIDEIRRASKDGVSAADKQKAQIDNARVQFLEPNHEELFSGFGLPDTLEPKAGEHFSLALVRKNPDGTGSIVFGTSNTAVVESVLAIAGKSLKGEAVKAVEAEAAKRTAEVKQQNMAALAAAVAESHGQTANRFVPKLNIQATSETLPA
jgi:hypothetical protein